VEPPEKPGRFTLGIGGRSHNSLASVDGGSRVHAASCWTSTGLTRSLLFRPTRLRSPCRELSRGRSRYGSDRRAWRHDSGTPLWQREKETRSPLATRRVRAAWPFPSWHFPRTAPRGHVTPRSSRRLWTAAQANRLPRTLHPLRSATDLDDTPILEFRNRELDRVIHHCEW